MTKDELTKKWTNQERPKYPKPAYAIGDVVKFVAGDEDEPETSVVTGLKIHYFSFFRRYEWKYEISGCIWGNPDGWFDADELKKVPEIDISRDDKARIAKNFPPVCECWNCHQVRVDDIDNCPVCNAYALPF